MIKSNKLLFVISSVLILLPMLVGIVFLGELPDSMTVHFGADGNADGASGKVFAVLGLPCILLLLHWLCIFITAKDLKNKNQSKKVFAMVLWIMPALSFFVNGIMYAYALEIDVNIYTWTLLLIGVLFVIMGNYMPKCRQNHTIGVKIKWTLGNEENWNKTHRVTGVTWVLCGIVMLICAFLPINIAVTVMLISFAVAVAVPFLYSYLFYKKQLADGVEYAPESNISKTGKIITLVTVPIILLIVLTIMFTGNIKMQYGEESFTVEASYSDDLTLAYAEIDSIEYRESFDAGFRCYGFGSPRLSIGTFENDEFGKYTLYSYTACGAAVVITVDEKILVINGRTADATKVIYDEINVRMK